MDATVPFDERLAFFADRAPRTRQGRIALRRGPDRGRPARRGGRAVCGRPGSRTISARPRSSCSSTASAQICDRPPTPRGSTACCGTGGSTRRDACCRGSAPQSGPWPTARLKLQQSDPGVEAALAALPAQARRDAGVMYDRLRWRRKNGSEAGVREILLNPPDELRRPELWWREQDKAIRAALAERSFKLAYRLASASRQTERHPLRRGRVAGRLAGAAVHRPAEGGAAAFRAAVAGRGDADQQGPRRLLVGPGRRRRRAIRCSAATWYERAAAYPNSFYGQLAAAEIGRDPAARIPAARAGLAGRARRAAAAHAGGAGRACSAAPARPATPSPSSAIWATRRPTIREELAAVVELAQGCGRADLVLAATRGAAGNGTHLVRESYPAAADRRRSGAITTAWPEPALVLAVARQESLFDPARTQLGRVPWG